MKNGISELSAEQINQVSGGLDGELFLQGLGIAAIGVVAIASAPFVAPLFGIGLALSGGIAGLGGGAVMTLSTLTD